MGNAALRRRRRGRNFCFDGNWVDRLFSGIRLVRGIHLRLAGADRWLEPHLAHQIRGVGVPSIPSGRNPVLQGIMTMFSGCTQTEAQILRVRPCY